jgi:RNA polymerase sigma-70 factor (ECF subfamily)
METSRVLERPTGGRAESEGADRARDSSLDLAGLYDRYAGPLYRYLLAMLSSEHDAEDALQEVFLALARRPGGAIRDMRAYLFKTARHHAIQVLRKRRQREDDPVRDGVSWVNPDACRPEDMTVALDIDRALRNLPAEQREVVVLHVTEGLTFREIAKLCGIPSNTASSRYRLALSRLREMLKGGDSGDG